MNAAAQRRLTPVVGATVAVLGVALLSLLFGAGRGVNWEAPRPVPSLPAVRAVTLPTPAPLQSLAQTWDHPLFSADRKPIVTQGGGSEGVSLGDLQLTGIILTPKLHMALLGPVNGKGDEGKQVSVREGANLPDSSWKLLQVLPRSAIFASPSGRTELKLPAGAPIDQQASPNPSQGNPPPIPMNNPGQPPEAPQPGSGHMIEPSPPPPPNDAQAERLQKLRAAILKQRSQRQMGNQGDH
ncbi:general secretion pathway protein GspN [Dyella choica]|uniref:General secretion pathway protein GspN n=1 Tax=Dyella choica TaxID=1927959 RepID=A0A3S0R3F2_9GAMM|nr:general secretion pathway protein GspN [Dyella choica]RUL74892.1 general secretion pathway protein GspN [Dyella choica]